MYRTSEAIEVELLRRREAEEGAPFVRNPNLIAHNIPHPHGESGRPGGERYALFVSRRLVSLVCNCPARCAARAMSLLSS